jgi:hypothetical protein
MASADFCLVSPRNYSQGRCFNDVRVLWLPRRFPRDLNQTPMVTRTATRQTSPDKNVICPAATAPFTMPLEPRVSLCCANSPRGLRLL